MTDAFAEDQAEIAALEKQQAAAGQGPGGKGVEQQEQPAPREEAAPAETQTQEQPAPERNEDEIEVENQGRFIRASAYKAAEERRKDAEKRAQEVEAKYAADMARVTERLALLVENRQTAEQKQAEPQIQIPDINTDPLGHFQAKSALLEKQLGEINEWRKGQEKTSEQQTALQRVGEEVTRLEAEFTRQTPDYGDAMAHLRQTWIAEAKVAGVPEQVAIRARAMEIAQLASRSNRNPAELGYELAKARGYAKKAPGTTAQTQTTGPTLETLQRGIASSKSTSAAPGRAAPGTPTIDALLQMDDDEFIKNYVGRDNPKWRKIAGGYAH